MRQPIDDIFKDGLSNQVHAVKQEDWLKAKDMLDLKKRKKRFPIWWFVIAAGILLGAIVLFAFPKDLPNNTNIAIVESHSLDQVTSTGKSAQSISNAVNENTVNTQNKIPNNSKNALNSSVPSKVGVDEKDLANAVSKSVESKSSRIINNNPSKEFSEIINSVKNSKGALQEMAEVNFNPISSSENEQHLSNPNIQKEAMSPAVEGTKLLTGNIIPRKEHNISKSIAYLAHEINKFKIDFPLPQIQNPSESILDWVTAPDVKINPWAFDIYAAYSTPHSKPSLGFTLNRNINNNWSSSIGMGINYYRRDDFEFSGELALIDLSGFRQLSNLSETLAFRQFALEVPISIGYRIRRHSILAIAMVEFNLYSELSQDAVISTADMADIEPSLSPIASDPITVTQRSKTINEPSLSKPKYHIGLGYGFEISRKVSLQAQGLWDVSSSNDENFNSLGISNSSLLKDSNWHLRTTLSYRF